MNWIDKLERRFGSWAIPNLAVYLIGLQAIGVVLLISERTSADQLFLHGSSVLHRGEWWRLISFMMLPETLSPLFLFFAFYVFFMISNSLEEYWGAFKYNLFILTGFLLTVLSAFIRPGMIVTNTYFLGAVFLAFATIFPHVTFRLFLLIPVKGEVVGLADSGRLFIDLIESKRECNGIGSALGRDSGLRDVSPFFCEGFNRWSSSESAKKVFTEEFEAKQEQARHICAFCGATEKSHPELSFRYCSQTGKCYGGCSKCENSSDRK